MYNRVPNFVFLRSSSCLCFLCRHVIFDEFTSPYLKKPLSSQSLLMTFIHLYYNLFTQCLLHYCKILLLLLLKHYSYLSLSHLQLFYLLMALCLFRLLYLNLYILFLFLLMYHPFLSPILPEISLVVDLPFLLDFFPLFRVNLSLSCLNLICLVLVTILWSPEVRMVL